MKIIEEKEILCNSKKANKENSPLTILFLDIPKLPKPLLNAEVGRLLVESFENPLVSMPSDGYYDHSNTIVLSLSWLVFPVKEIRSFLKLIFFAMVSLSAVRSSREQLPLLLPHLFLKGDLLPFHRN